MILALQDFVCIFLNKTKRTENYIMTMPVFTRGDHPVVGVGFTYETMQSLSDVSCRMRENKARKLSHYTKEISILQAGGVSYATISDIFNVTRQSIYNLFNGSMLS